MNNNEREELRAHLRALHADRAEDSRQMGLADQDEYAAALTDMADLLWESAQGAPPLEHDPVAAMLGLVPDAARGLDGSGLAQARKNAGLSASQLAERLRTRGWKVQTGDVFRWENRAAPNVAPALIEAIADELGIAATRLIADNTRSPEHDLVAAARQSSEFADLVDRWASLQNQSPQTAASALESRMLATVHRGDRPDLGQMLRALRVLIESVEKNHPGGHE